MVRYIPDIYGSVKKIELSIEEWKRIERRMPYQIENTTRTIFTKLDALYINTPNQMEMSIGSEFEIAKKIKKMNEICIITSGQYGYIDPDLENMIREILRH